MLEKNIYYILTTDQVLKQLHTDDSVGLGKAEAELRLKSCGANNLTEKPPKSLWLLLLEQFTGFLILVLIGAAVLAGAIGEIKDAAVILVVVLINALLGFYQEYRAEKSLAALKKCLHQRLRYLEMDRRI